MESIKLIVHNSNYLQLQINGLSRKFLNSLRRIIISEIPTLAFDCIIFKNNTSEQNETVLSHRISMLPLLCSDIRKINDKEQNKNNLCCDSYCEKCSVTFQLKEKNTDKHTVLYFFSSDLKNIDPRNTSTEIVSFTRNEKGFLLGKLFYGESIELKAIATRGRADHHAKWNSVNVCSFYLDEKESKEEEDSYIFFLETNDNLDPLTVFIQALIILERDIIRLQNILSMVSSETNDHQKELPFCDTIMNLFSETILDNYSNEIDFCFYKRSHFLNRGKDITSKLQIFPNENNSSIIPLDIDNILFDSANILISKINRVRKQCFSMKFL